MNGPHLDRRALLKLGGGVWLAALGATHLPTIAASASQQRGSGKFASLSANSAAVLDAMTARIIPTTDTPGAREAGAIWFVDALLDGDMANAAPMINQGCAELNVRANGDFAQLPTDRQDQLLTDIEDGEFFELVLFLTIAGTFTMSQYGGNKGDVGWNLLGFDRRHHWQAPFGHYDKGMHGDDGMHREENAG